MEIVIIRPYQESDKPLIFSSWRNAIWYETHTGTDPRNDIDPKWFKEKTEEIKKCLESATVNMASLKSDPNFLVGYAVIKDKTVEFVYVKLDYRKQGIASILCKGLKLGQPVTKVGSAIVRRTRRTNEDPLPL